jgi:hypothetical protein
MSNYRRHSIPSLLPQPPAAAQAFSNASQILSETSPLPIRRTFVAKAREIRTLADRLAALMEVGTPLDEIDKLARELAMKCLQAQQETLKARADGVR